MSVPPSHTPDMPPPHERNGCMTAVMLAIGLVLLLPGICALILVGIDPKEMMRDSNWALLMLVLLAIGAGGVALIWHTLKRQR